MVLLAVNVAGYAFVAMWPGFPAPLVRKLAASHRAAMLAHFAGGGTALALGALQTSRWLRSRALTLHRWLGRVYVTAVLVGGVAGFRLAFQSTGGWVTHLGFGLLAIAWVASTVVGYRAVRAGDLDQHRDWMLRSYALTFAAVTLRVYLAVCLMAGISFEAAYPAISWLCWIPNLLFTELFLVSRRVGGGIQSPTRAT
jgi:uncharacterized membrane protein